MRSLKQIVNELLTIASELEVYETNLSQLLGMADGGVVQRTIPKELPTPSGLSGIPKKQLFTQAQRDQIRLLYKQGRSQGDLVDIYKSTPRQIAAILFNRPPTSTKPAIHQQG